MIEKIKNGTTHEKRHRAAMWNKRPKKRFERILRVG